MFRKYKKKLIVIGVVLALLTVILFVLPDNSKVVGWYNNYAFRPFQSFRNAIFGIFPFSIGDFLYLAGGLFLVITIGKWICYFLHIRKHKHQLALSFIRSLNTLGIIYIIFLLGWGGNYYKQPLSIYWNLNEDSSTHNKESLKAFTLYLIDQLNQTAPLYSNISFRVIDSAAKAYYEEYTNHGSYASKVKPSLFGNWMQYMRIQGYYNPFTGEAQVNKNLPSFMLPFVICHEMAHQQGIAKEDDANLLAYTLSTMVNDPDFRYSAYFNMWLYAHRRMYMTDSAAANELKMQLNKTTLAHIDELIALREKYASDMSDYSADIYDGYLKLHHQNEGIRSYSRVWHSAWALEEKRKGKKEKIILIP